MASVPIEAVTDEPEDDGDEVKVEYAEDSGGEQRRESRSRRTRTSSGAVEVEIEREITRRRLIESVTSIVIVVLYMIFTLLRERDAGVVILDDEGGPEDDWAE